MRAQVSARTSQPSRSNFSGPSSYLWLCLFWKFLAVPEDFCRWGRTKPPSFWICDSNLCYNSTWLLLVLGRHATLLVNLQTGDSLHNEISKSTSWKKLCWPSNGHSTLPLYNDSAYYMCKYLSAEFWVPFCTSVCALEKLCSVVMWWDLSVS